LFGAVVASLRRETFIRRRRVVAIGSAIAAVLLTNPSSGSGPTVVNGRIAFATARDGNAELYLLRSAGSAQTRLTNNAFADGDPAWSIDGRIAFTREANGSSDLYAISAVDRSTVRLTSSPAGVRTADPSWSPTAERLVYASTKSGNWDIYRLALKSSREVPLTTDPGNDTQPAWSPKGGTIAFVSDRKGNRDIWVVNENGKGQVDRTNSPADDADPAWSPDGTQIVFTRTQAGNADIWVMNAAGGNAHPLTQSPAQEIEPAWSPTGTRIAFATNRDGDYEVYVMAPNGDLNTYQDWSNSHPADDRDPNWETTFPAPGAAPRGAPDVISYNRVCTEQGTNEADRGSRKLEGTSEGDTICGFAGPDVIVGRGGNDNLYGDEGNDMIRARDGVVDQVHGGPGKDVACVDVGRVHDGVDGVEKINPKGVC
jgi:Tol biopolymer transport system component